MKQTDIPKSLANLMLCLLYCLVFQKIMRKIKQSLEKMHLTSLSKAETTHRFLKWYNIYSFSSSSYAPYSYQESLLIANVLSSLSQFLKIFPTSHNQSNVKLRLLGGSMQ